MEDVVFLMSLPHSHCWRFAHVLCIVPRNEKSAIKIKSVSFQRGSFFRVEFLMNLPIGKN